MFIITITAVQHFKVFESCTNFVFIKTSFGKELWEFLKQKSIVIRYMGDYIRISVGTADEVDQTLEAIKAYFER